MELQWQAVGSMMCTSSKEPAWVNHISSETFLHPACTNLIDSLLASFILCLWFVPHCFINCFSKDVPYPGGVLAYGSGSQGFFKKNQPGAAEFCLKSRHLHKSLALINQTCLTLVAEHCGCCTLQLALHLSQPVFLQLVTCAHLFLVLLQRCH